MEEILKTLNYQPVTLSTDELANPDHLLSTFFDNQPIQEFRAGLWEMYKAWTHHSAEYTDAEQTRSMMDMYSAMIDLVNAVFIREEYNKMKSCDN